MDNSLSRRVDLYANGLMTVCFTPCLLDVCVKCECPSRVRRAFACVACSLLLLLSFIISISVSSSSFHCVGFHYD